MSNPGNHKIVIKLLELFDGSKCKICKRIKGQRIRDSNDRLKLTLDHIVPLSSGGARWHLDNLQLLCKDCNNKKGSKITEDIDRAIVEIREGFIVPSITKRQYKGVINLIPKTNYYEELKENGRY